MTTIFIHSSVCGVFWFGFVIYTRVSRAVAASFVVCARGVNIESPGLVSFERKVLSMCERYSEL